MELEIIDCGREACAPGHSYGPAMRGYYLMHLVASGSGTFIRGERRMPVRAGQGFMIFPEDITVYSADARTPWDYVWVGFSGADAARLVEGARIDPRAPVFDLGGYAADALAICYGIGQDMATLELGAQAAEGGLMRLMAYVARARSDAGRSGQSATDSWCKAQWAMHANFQHPEYRVEDVAAFVGLSRSQLFRIYKRYGGVSPQRALGELRLSRARQLLSGTELTLTEVALSSGYASAARLGEVFRDALHTTPGAYRRASREDGARK